MAGTVAQWGTEVTFRIMPATRNFLQVVYGRSQWPRGLRRESAAARFLELWVRIPPGAWMPVSLGCCMLSGKGFCD